MSRSKRARRRYEEARKGLNPDQIAHKDLKEYLDNLVKKMGQRIHAEKFPEEYDYMMDSSVDSITRSKGESPMSAEYIEKIRKKREAEGVSQLSNAGLSDSNDTTELCENEARKLLFGNPCSLWAPSDNCVFCNKSLEEIGGRRITKQQTRGVSLIYDPSKWANEDPPREFVRLYEDVVSYLMTWGEKDEWSDATKERAVEEYKAGRRPWFCQECGDRLCPDCNAPLVYPVGSRVIEGNGERQNVTPPDGDSGCINKSCSNCTLDEGSDLYWLVTAMAKKNVN